ncbi:hypothetical protein JW859_14915 [bacterium]|nr:hypothetical protein [bacterium]
MKSKTIISAVLLLFVAVSVVVIVVKESGRQANAQPVETPAPATQTVAAAVSEKAPEQQFICYYFRTNVRCPSCIKIESWTEAAVTENFADQLEDGLLVFKTVNTEDQGNEHYVDDYELYTKQVILVEFAKGKQVRWKNLAAVWDLLGDQDKFSAYIVDELTAFMAGEDPEDEAAGEDAEPAGLDTGSGSV